VQIVLKIHGNNNPKFNLRAGETGPNKLTTKNEVHIYRRNINGALFVQVAKSPLLSLNLQFDIINGANVIVGLLLSPPLSTARQLLEKARQN